MVGKIVQLLGIPLQKGFQVVYGIYGIDPEHSDRKLDFGTITFQRLDLEASKTHFNGYFIEQIFDGLMEKLVISNCEIEKDDEESSLMVIIPELSKLKTKSKRIIDEYSNEAILEMYEGDTVEVSRSVNGDSEVYKAVKKGRKMFLIQES